MTPVQFRDAAVADGWSIEPTYGHEPEAHAASLKRDGYHMMTVTRPESKNHSVHLWCPKGIAIKVPPAYDFEAIKAGTRVCAYCGATDADTVRVGFAGRACKTCQPKEEAKLGPRYYD